MKLFSKILNKFGFSNTNDELKLLRNQLAELREHKERYCTPDANKLQRFSRKMREGKLCDHCHSSESLTLHHLWPKSKHPELAFEEDNVVVLCETCHNSFHNHWGTLGTSPKSYEYFKMIGNVKQAHSSYSKHKTKQKLLIQAEKEEDIKKTERNYNEE